MPRNTMSKLQKPTVEVYVAYAVNKEFDEAPTASDIVLLATKEDADEVVRLLGEAEEHGYCDYEGKRYTPSLYLVEGEDFGGDAYSVSQTYATADRIELSVADALASMCSDEPSDVEIVQTAEADAESKGGDIDDIRPGDRFV